MNWAPSAKKDRPTSARDGDSDGSADFRRTMNRTQTRPKMTSTFTKLQKRNLLGSGGKPRPHSTVDQDYEISRPASQQYSPSYRIKKARVSRLGEDGIKLLKLEKDLASN